MNEREKISQRLGKYMWPHLYHKSCIDDKKIGKVLTLNTNSSVTGDILMSLTTLNTWK